MHTKRHVLPLLTALPLVHPGVRPEHSPASRKRTNRRRVKEQESKRVTPEADLSRTKRDQSLWSKGKEKRKKKGFQQSARGWPSSHRFWDVIILETKLTMALAGCSGSISANRWLTLSVVLPCFRATNPNNLAVPPSGLFHFLS